MGGNSIGFGEEIKKLFQTRIGIVNDNGARLGVLFIKRYLDLFSIKKQKKQTKKTTTKTTCVVVCADG